MYKHILFALIAVNSSLVISSDKQAKGSHHDSPGTSPRSAGLRATETGQPKTDLRVSIPPRGLPRDLNICDCLRNACPWLAVEIEKFMNPHGINPKKD
jgi:hypothetical protein